MQGFFSLYFWMKDWFFKHFDFWKSNLKYLIGLFSFSISLVLKQHMQCMEKKYQEHIQKRFFIWGFGIHTNKVLYCHFFRQLKEDWEGPTISHTAQNPSKVNLNVVLLTHFIFFDDLHLKSSSLGFHIQEHDILLWVLAGFFAKQSESKKSNISNMPIRHMYWKNECFWDFVVICVQKG